MMGIDGARARTRRATRWVKSGLSMMTSASGRGSHNGVGGFADAPQDHRQARRYGAEADDREFVDRKWTDDALGRHGAPADTGERQRAAGAGAQRARERCAERIAGFLRGDQIDRQRSRLRRAVHRLASSETPTKKIFSRSAAALTLAGSATIALPAATASPARPARATFSTVFGPIAGRSKRRSWPGLGALTSTPTPARFGEPPLAAQLRNPHEHIVGAFGGFQRYDMTIGDHRRLADIERPERANELEPVCNVGAITRRRRIAAERACRHDDFRRHLFDADDPQAALLEQGGDAGKQPVVAAAKDASDARHQPQRLPIEPDLREPRPQQRADKHSLPATLGAREAKEAARLSDGNPMVRVALDHFRISPAAHREHYRPAAAPLDRLGDRTWKTAATADDRDRLAAGRRFSCAWRVRGHRLRRLRLTARRQDASAAASRRRG